MENMVTQSLPHNILFCKLVETDRTHILTSFAATNCVRWHALVEVVDVVSVALLAEYHSMHMSPRKPAIVAAIPD